MTNDPASEPQPSVAAARGPGAVQDAHSLPDFEGTASRRHSSRSLWRLRLQAAVSALRSPLSLNTCETFVQFAGFPRSGHSLIGALLDAHPQAVIAHELDAMGLVKKGFSGRDILQLSIANSARFALDGRWWNGFCYDVPNAPARVTYPRVIGDKKGDWSMRWSALEPELISQLPDTMKMSCKWILITRHPLDNVATMSLRQGRVYDRLRIAHRDDPAGLHAAVHSGQDAGEISREALDDMVLDYRALAAAVAQAKARIDPSNWIEISYEDFVARGEYHLRRIAEFLQLDQNPQWLSASQAIISSKPAQSRTRVVWRKDQIAALQATVNAHSFLNGYKHDF